MSDHDFWEDLPYSEAMMGLGYATKEEIDWCIERKKRAFERTRIK